MMPRRIAIVAGVAGAAVLAGSAAFAAWNGAGHGSAYSKALSVNAPQTATATTVSSTAIDIKVTNGPGSGPTPTSYEVMRGTTTVCASVALNTNCHDTGLSASTPYTYDVFSLLGAWISTGSAHASATTSAAPDTTPPTAPTITSPTGGNYFATASTSPPHTAWPGSFAGAPGTDGGSGVNRVEIQLFYTPSHQSTAVYWNGTSFTTTPAWVSVGTTWNYTWAASSFPSPPSSGDTYTVTARTVDNAGNVSTSNPSVSFTYKG